MATFEDVENHISSTPAFLGELLNDPKEALKNANIELESEADVRNLEVFLRLTQLNIQTAAQLVNLKVKETAAWGIGYSCCNNQPLFR